MEKISIILNSDRREIKKIEEQLVILNKQAGIRKEKFINLQIAVSEALINAIIHGNKLDKSKKVFIVIEYDTGFIGLSIKDEGKGFDINSLPNPTAEENLLKESGRGIFIIRSLVDYFECSSGESGTYIKLAMKE